MIEAEEILGTEITAYNKMHLDNLKEKIKADGVSWGLGAGISVPAGLPQWDSLLMNMWTLLTEINNSDKKDEADAFEKQYDCLRDILYSKQEYKDIYKRKFYKNLKGENGQFLKGLNVLEAAEYLWNSIQEHTLSEDSIGNADMKCLKTLIKEALLLGIKDRKQVEKILYDEDARTRLKSKLEKESIDVIAQILKKYGRGNVITYNFEDLFEFCLEKMGIEEKDIWIGCDNHRVPGEQTIRVYHPHGKIQIFSNCEPKESDGIVLTESSYYAMESTVYNWANSIQAKELAEKSCIFVGFSGTDYNFRRIIKNCHEQKGKECHYIFIGIDALVSKFLGDVSGKNQKKLNDPEFIFERVQMLNFCCAQTKYWGKYGIVPIWTTFGEMPQMLRYIGCLV